MCPRPIPSPRLPSGFCPRDVTFSDLRSGPLSETIFPPTRNRLLSSNRDRTLFPCDGVSPDLFRTTERGGVWGQGQGPTNGGHEYLYIHESGLSLLTLLGPSSCEILGRRVGRRTEVPCWSGVPRTVE